MFDLLLLTPIMLISSTIFFSIKITLESNGDQHTAKKLA